MIFNQESILCNWLPMVWMTRFWLQVPSEDSPFPVTDGSLPPTVSLADPSAFNAVTSTSIIPLSASGEDPDGALVDVQYYVDGVAYGSPLLRKAGITELSQNYATQLDLFSITQSDWRRPRNTKYFCDWSR